MPPRAKRQADPVAGDTEDVEHLLTVMTDHGHALWLWRRAGDRWSFLESRSPETFRALGIREATRQRTGGGEYRVRVRGTNGQWGPQRNFSIEGEQKPIPSSGPASQTAAAPASGSFELPSWVEKIVLPIAVAAGTAIVSKMTAEPKTDPLLLELLRQRGQGAGVDPLELQRLLLEREQHGEDRGRQLGELTAKRERAPAPAPIGGSGVADAIREMLPLAKDLMNARNQVAGGDRRRVLAAPSTGQAVNVAQASDIIPAWLRPVMSYKAMLLNAADFMTAGPIAGMVIENADDATWAAMREAASAGRLESDLYAAIPELSRTRKRQEFVSQLLADVRAELLADTRAADETAELPADTPAAEKAKPARKTPAKRAAGV